MQVPKSDYSSTWTRRRQGVPDPASAIGSDRSTIILEIGIRT